MEIEGVWDLPVPIELHADVLTRPFFQIQIGGHTGRLIPPRKPSSEGDRPLVPPRLHATHSSTVNSSPDWGWYFGDFHAAKVKKLLLRFPITPARRQLALETGDAIREHIDTWLRLFVDWSQRITGQRFEISRHILDGSLGGRLFFASRDSEGSFHAQSQGGGGFGGVFSMNPLGFDQWTLSLRKASKEETLPLEHRLVSASIIDLGRSNRISLINACTASEVAIRTFVRNYHAGTLSSSRQTFGRFLNALIDKGLVDKSTAALLKTNILNPRNDCVHDGFEPTFEQTHRAVQIAAQVTAALRPLRGGSVASTTLLELDLRSKGRS